MLHAFRLKGSRKQLGVPERVSLSRELRIALRCVLRGFFSYIGGNFLIDLANVMSEPVLEELH